MVLRILPVARAAALVAALTGAAGVVSAETSAAGAGAGAPRGACAFVPNAPAPPAQPRCSTTPRRRPGCGVAGSLASSPPNDHGDGDEGGMSRIAAQLERMRAAGTTPAEAAAMLDDDGKGSEWHSLFDELRRRPANALKEELKGLRLSTKGRKPEMARRLADYLAAGQDGAGEEEDDDAGDAAVETVPAQHMVDDDASTASAAAAASSTDVGDRTPVTSFAGLRTLSPAASVALTRASFAGATPVQTAAVPLIARGESALLHAETGSGKTLAYLLPITETLWMEREAGIGAEGPLDGTGGGGGYGLILTPTRELAAQVAGVATVLAPPGSVRLVGKPTDLMGNDAKDRGDSERGGRRAREGREDDEVPRLIVGSAKAIYTSLFGNEKMAATPTSKPMAKALLRGVRWMVMDEVDRLLNVKKSRSEKRFKRHEKPAAVLASTVARQTLGRAQVVAASATVGRPLRRELSRVLGLDPRDCPEIIRGAGGTSDATAGEGAKELGGGDGDTMSRAVTIPASVRHYVVPCSGSTSGSLLTSAAFCFKSLPPGRRTLLVLSRECGLSVRNALGALTHFGCRPEPRSLLDALEAEGGTDRMIEVHRAVSGAAGIGESTADGAATNSGEAGGDDGYFLITGEDSVRGLHLDGLDSVIVVGRPQGPDEYTHIAGRTGRAGKGGDVVNVVSYEQAAALAGWERMLGVDFIPMDAEELSEL